MKLKQKQNDLSERKKNKTKQIVLHYFINKTPFMVSFLKLNQLKTFLIDSIIKFRLLLQFIFANSSFILQMQCIPRQSIENFNNLHHNCIVSKIKMETHLGSGKMIFLLARAAGVHFDFSIAIKQLTSANTASKSAIVCAGCR